MDRLNGIEEHVGEQLSGYLDGELTQQQRQRIDLHLDRCEECTGVLQELSDIRSRMGRSQLSPEGEDHWREMLDETGVSVSRGIGWVLLIGAAVVLFGIVVIQFVMDDSINGFIKLLISAIYLGLAALFISVLRQRLIERKTDKYKDVEI